MFGLFFAIALPLDMCEWVCVCFHSSCLTGALGAWEDLCPFAGLLTAGLACFPSLSLGASLSALYSGRLWRERLMDNEDGRKGETLREGEEKKDEKRPTAICSFPFNGQSKQQETVLRTNLDFLYYMNTRSNLLRLTKAETWLLFLLFRSFSLHSSVLFLWKQVWFGHYLSGFQAKCWLVSI